MNTGSRACRALFAVAAVTGAILSVACTNWPRRIETTTVTDLDIRHLETFAFLPEASPSESTSTDPLQEVRDAIAEKLRNKGYGSAPASPPDFLLTFYANLNEPLAPEVRGYSAETWEEAHPEQVPELPLPSDALSTGGTWQAGYHRDPNEYVSMIIVVDVIDPDSDALLWRGWARSEESTEIVDFGEIATVAAAVMEKFPERRRP